MITDNFIVVDVPKSYVDLARARAIEVEKKANANGLHARFQTNTIDNKTAGFLGEMIFEEWLKSNNIEYQTDRTVGAADQFDFKIKGKKWDIKTGVRRDPMKYLNGNFGFLINYNQSEKPKDFYFYVMLHENKAYLCGFIGRGVLGDYGMYHNSNLTAQALKIPISHLVPPECALNIMDPQRLGDIYYNKEKGRLHVYQATKL